jgi:hypothetical protein
MRTPEKTPPIKGARKIGSIEKTDVAESMRSCNKTMKRPHATPTRIDAGT